MILFYWFRFLVKIRIFKMDRFTKDAVTMYEFRKISDGKFDPFHHFTLNKNGLHYDGEFIYRGTVIHRTLGNFSQVKKESLNLKKDLDFFSWFQIKKINNANLWDGYKIDQVNTRTYIKEIILSQESCESKQ